MKHLLLRLEPLIWLLFGQGIMIGTMLLTGWLLVVGLEFRQRRFCQRSQRPPVGVGQTFIG